MGQGFFEITSPRDLLDKAKRDYEKMKTDTSSDTVFNFFVTAYHVMDYVKALGTIDKPAIDQLYADADFRMCQFLCNKGKHIKLRSKEPFKAKHQPAIEGGTLGSFEFGFDCLGGPERFVLLDGDQVINVIELGERLIDKWEGFFVTHGIS